MSGGWKTSSSGLVFPSEFLAKSVTLFSSASRGEVTFFRIQSSIRMMKTTADRKIRLM